MERGEIKQEAQGGAIEQIPFKAEVKREEDPLEDVAVPEALLHKELKYRYLDQYETSLENYLAQRRVVHIRQQLLNESTLKLDALR